MNNRGIVSSKKPISGNLISDIRRLIETARQNLAVTVNTGLTILYRDRRKPRLEPWMIAVEVGMSYH